MDTDQLEHDMNRLSRQKSMHGKTSTTACSDRVQAAARVFLFQALSAWTVLKSTRQTEQLTPDLQTVAQHPRRRGAACAPDLQREGDDPEVLTVATTRLRRRGLAPGGNLLVARPSPSSVATSPVHSCQRCTITSQYFGSSSTSRACRPAFSQAISVEPEPPNGSSTMSRLLLEFRIARSTSATGFMVGWRSFLAGLSTNQTSP